MTSSNQLDFSRIAMQIENNCQRFIAACTQTAASRSAELTPVEYSTLRNSQFTNITRINGGFRGTVGYGVYYAKYLNGLPGYRTPTWSPRPIEEKQGPATNMNAVPRFLDLGFEESADQFERFAEALLPLR